MSTENGNQDIVILTERSKVLKTPGRFIGSIESREIEKMVVTPDLKSVIEKLVNFNPGLFKIVEEVFDNALDICKKKQKEGVKVGSDTVTFQIDDTCQWITISDNATGIPTMKAKNEDGSDAGMTMYEAAWTKLGAGSNFDGFTEDDSEARGQNGEGVSLTNIFSKAFNGYTQYQDTFVSVNCTDNMEFINVAEEQRPGQASGTTVQFLPDYARFGETHFSQDHQFVVMYYFAILSIQNPNIKFMFNGVQIKYSMEQLVNGLTHGKKQESEMLKVDGLTVIVLQSDNAKFNQYINGSDADAGGNPIEWVIKKVTEGFVSALPKKHKEMKPSFVESKLQIIALFDGMIKPRFEGQTKNKCITQYKDFRHTIDEKKLDWVAFGKKLTKNKIISNNIFIFHEAEMKAQEKKNLGKEDKARKGTKEPAKFSPAIKHKKYLVLAEGDSAINSIMANCDRFDKGYLPLGGVPKNALIEKKAQKIAANAEFKQLCSPKILNMSFTGDNHKMNYENVVSATDADPDGVHIDGLLIGFMYYMNPKALMEGRFKLLPTPIVMSKYKTGPKKEKTAMIFFTQLEYDTAIMQDPSLLTDYDHEYKKGLGSLSKVEFQEFFAMYSFEELLVTVKLRNPDTDPEGYIRDVTLLDSWLREDKDFRKAAINKYVDYQNEFEAGARKIESEFNLTSSDGRDIDSVEIIETTK